MAPDNISLGRFHLVGIPPAPRGVPQIEVSFDIDANGIVNVTAKDLGTGKEQAITITATSNLSKEDIDRAVKDAESHAEDDARKKDVAETRNQAEQTVFQYRKILDEVKDKIGPEKVANVEAAIKELEDAVAKDDYELIKTKLDELNKVFSEVSQEMYAHIAQEQAQQSGGPEVGANGGAPAQDPGGSSNAADAVDADYTILDEEE
jgi:molecular chaperone DnaK